MDYSSGEEYQQLVRMIEERDNLHQAFFEETRKMQRLAREHVKKVLDEQEMLNADLEKRRKKLDSWSKELNEREALTECEKQIFDEDKQKNDMQNSSLHKASIELKKADESVLRLVEEQKREKEEALKKVLELERQLYAKQKLEMEIEELKGKLQVMKHLGDEDDTAVQEQIKKMNDKLEAKMEEMDGVEEMNQSLVVKERQSNDELQEARKELIKNYMQNSSLHKVSTELKKANESVLKLVEEQKRKKEEALKKVLELEREKEEALKKVVELEREKGEALKKVVELERQLDDNGKLEMEIKELKGKLQVMELLGEEHGTAV